MVCASNGRRSLWFTNVPNVESLHHGAPALEFSSVSSWPDSAWYLYGPKPWTPLLIGMVTVMRASNSPAASAALPNLLHPVTPTSLLLISGARISSASSTRWNPQAQAARVPAR